MKITTFRIRRAIASFKKYHSIELTITWFNSCWDFSTYEVRGGEQLFKQHFNK